VGVLLLLACADAPSLEDTAPEAAPVRAWVDLEDRGDAYVPTCRWEPEVQARVSWYLDDGLRPELDVDEIGCETQVRCLVENSLGGASSAPVSPAGTFELVLRARPVEDAWLCEVDCGSAAEGLYRFDWDGHPGPLLWPGPESTSTCHALGAGEAWLELERPASPPLDHVYLHADVPGERLGFSLASSDLDGDGAMDLILGAPNHDASEDWMGAVYVVPGRELGREELSLGAPTGTGLGRANYLGWSVAGLADRDGDGLGEVLVGAPGQDDRATLAGAVYLLDGDELQVDLRQVPTWQGDPERLWAGVDVAASEHGLLAGGYGWLDNLGGAWELGGVGLLPEPDLEGQVPEGYLGLAVAWAGDLDGDGLPEWAAGAPFADQVLVVGEAGIEVLSGPDDSLYGWDLAGVGDFDGDGLDELLIAAPGSQQAFTSSGLSLSLAAQSVASPGDVDGDGQPELWIGEPGLDRTTLVFRDGTELVLSGPESFGRGLSAVPDLNGDGLPELLVGAPEDQDQAGGVWILASPFHSDRSL
jgi:hypothetical protein